MAGCHHHLQTSPEFRRGCEFTWLTAKCKVHAQQEITNFTLVTGQPTDRGHTTGNSSITVTHHITPHNTIYTTSHHTTPHHTKPHHTTPHHTTPHTTLMARMMVLPQPTACIGSGHSTSTALWYASTTVSTHVHMYVQHHHVCAKWNKYSLLHPSWPGQVLLTFHLCTSESSSWCPAGHGSDIYTHTHRQPTTATHSHMTFTHTHTHRQPTITTHSQMTFTTHTHTQATHNRHSLAHAPHNCKVRD